MTENHSISQVSDPKQDHTISLIGNISQTPVSLHSTFHTPMVVTGKRGRAPGELILPHGVTIHEVTHQIFIADVFNHRVEIFSETGEFFYQLDVGQLSVPYRIATHGDNVYVSCWHQTINIFSLIDMSLLRKIGSTV